MNIISKEYGRALLIIMVVILLIVAGSPISINIKNAVIDVVKDFSEFQADMEGNEAMLKENLALGKRTESSGEQAEGTLSEFATDGDEESRWASEFNKNQWLTVDLWNTYKINKVKIKWEAAYAKQYKILISTDNKNWTETAVVKNGKGETEEITFESTTARYVKFQGIERAMPDYGYSIYEFEVYGTKLIKENSEKIETGQNVAKNAIVESSGNESEYTMARNVVDGNMGTRWASKFEEKAWIYVNFGKKYKINKVKIYWENAYAKEYNVLTSIDGENWTTVATIKDGDGGTDEIAFNPINARYVKIKCNKKALEDYGYSIWEIEALTY